MKISVGSFKHEAEIAFVLNHLSLIMKFYPFFKKKRVLSLLVLSHS